MFRQMRGQRTVARGKEVINANMIA